MDLQNFLEIGIVGAAVSLVVALIKHYFGTEGNQSVAVSLIASLVAGAIYIYFKDTAYWPAFIQILTAATTIYAVVIKQVQEKLTQ